jgi:hypothetical protein
MCVLVSCLVALDSYDILVRDQTRLFLESEQALLPAYDANIMGDDFQRALHIRKIELLQPLRQRALEHKQKIAEEIKLVPRFFEMNRDLHSRQSRSKNKREKRLRRHLFGKRKRKRKLRLRQRRRTGKSEMRLRPLGLRHSRRRRPISFSLPSMCAHSIAHFLWSV